MRHFISQGGVPGILAPAIDSSGCSCNQTGAWFVSTVLGWLKYRIFF